VYSKARFFSFFSLTNSDTEYKIILTSLLETSNQWRKYIKIALRALNERDLELLLPGIYR
jgi:hypothetical protein